MNIVLVDYYLQLENLTSGFRLGGLENDSKFSKFQWIFGWIRNQ